MKSSLIRSFENIGSLSEHYLNHWTNTRIQENFRIISKLTKEGLIDNHPTGYGMQYSLNHDMIDKIQRMLES